MPIPFTAPLRFLSTNSSLKTSLLHLCQRKPFTQSPLPQALAVSGMDSESKNCTLVLCGKSSAEYELAKSLKEKNVLKLPDSTGISILLQSEADKATAGEEKSFRIGSFLNSLSTARFGRFLIWSPKLPSTHDVVSSVLGSNFCELPIGAVCVADVQYKGRGRTKNVWESPIGCLLFSFTIEMEDGRVVPLIQYVVSLAMTEAIKDVCHKNHRVSLLRNALVSLLLRNQTLAMQGTRQLEVYELLLAVFSWISEGMPILDVRIKWPNDLYLNSLKVGGILCTSTYRSKKFNVSAGIGLNIDNEKPTTSLNAELRKLTSDAHQLRKEDVLAAFFEKFENLFDIFINKGFQPLEQLYYGTWLHSGQRVILEEKDEDQLVEKVVTVQGLTSSGYLLAVGDDSQMCELHPDGNSFDFFKGLVRRKLN